MLEALLFPHTYLRLDLASLLLAVFDRVVLLQPSEAKPEGPFVQLIEKDMVRLLTPPPLGDKLPWFQRLVHAYEEWGQMMRWPENVSMFKAWPEAVEESVTEIKAEILGQRRSTDDPILRARVILQLAQNLDHRLEELDFEYEKLKHQAQRLSDFVVGQDPTLRRFPQWIVEGKEAHGELPGLEERLKAYAKLVPLLPSIPHCLATDQIEIRDRLLDLAPNIEKRGSFSLMPLRDENRQEILAQNQALLSRLDPHVEDPTPPCVEVWRVPAETKSLLLSLAEGKTPSPGETEFFYFVRS